MKALKKDIAQLGSELLNDVLSKKWGILHKHTPDDVPIWFTEYVATRLKAKD